MDALFFFNCKRKFGLSGVFPALGEENEPGVM